MDELKNIQDELKNIQKEIYDLGENVSRLGDYYAEICKITFRLTRLNLPNRFQPIIHEQEKKNA